MAEMTFFEAALQVLKEADGGPLHYREITSRAIGLGYIKSAGRTPAASLYAMLYVHIKKAETSGQEPQVRRISGGEFALSTRTKTGISKRIEESDAEVRSELFSQIMKLHPRSFENLVGALLSSIGFENVVVSQYTGDRGLDVEAELTVGGVADVKTAVQVKRWKSNVSGKIVRELRGGLMTDQRGLIITTSGFTKEAIREASAESKTPISLVDGEKLLDLLIQNEIGVLRKAISYLELDRERLEEFDEETSPTGQSLGLWPLPGGSKTLVDSTLKMLKYVIKSEPTRDQMIKWMPTAFPKVKSERTIWGYIRVLKTLDLIAFAGETIMITEAGSDALTGNPREVLLKQLSDRVAGISQYLNALQGNPMTLDESHEFFRNELSVEWETDYQTKMRLLWLENVGAIRRDGKVYMPD